RFVDWWSREYFGANAPAAVTAYNKYFTLLDKPDTMWNAMNNIQQLIDALYRKVAGKEAAFPAETVAQLETRAKALDDALASEEKAERAMPLAEAQFFATDAGLGIRIAHAQT